MSESKSLSKEELRNIENHIKHSLSKDQIEIQDITTPMNMLKRIWRRYYGIQL